MNHETKWDVFNKLLAAYLKDEKRLNKLVNEPDEHIPELDFMYFKKIYNAALPDNLPVIPKAVGVSIKEQKAKQSLGGALFDAIFAVNELGRTNVGPVVNWMVDNDETYANAWLTGVWRIEETGEIGGCN